MTQETRRRPGLQAKAVGLLLVVGAAPLIVSWVLVGRLVGQLGDVATRVAAGKADRLVEPLRRATQAYQEAVEARRAAAKNGAAAVAAAPEIAGLCQPDVPTGAGVDATRARLQTLLDADPTLARAVLRAGDTEIARAERSFVEPVREVTHERALGPSACILAVTYVLRAQLLEDNQALGQALREHRALERIQLTLPRTTVWQFVTLLGVVVVLTTCLAIVMARRATHRLRRLAEAARRVGEGDLAPPPALGGSDELGELSGAFEQMVGDLRRSRAEIEYLQKIGAWQEVARRLAHEIKNPLTPIQLAVQQLRAKYDGDDPRFRRMLDDAHAIVTEEVAALRRLVDAFSGFAKLPRVEPAPVDLALVIEDAGREQALEAEPPGDGQPVTALADRLLLRRVLVNLVENAREAGAKQVRVAWGRHGGQAGLARVTIDDDGPGVAQTIRARVFDPYVTTKEHGTGLGLAIVKKTLLEHGGDVTLEDAPSPLGGARFVLTLPLG